MKILKLSQCPEVISQATKLCYKSLVQRWSPENSLEKIESWFKHWLNDDIPLAFIALQDSKVVGMCSLQLDDGLHSNLIPWLGDLCVAEEHQNQGIGKSLVEAVKKKAKEEKFEKLYLFAPDPSVPPYYSRLGWKVIDTNVFHGNPVTVMEINL